MSAAGSPRPRQRLLGGNLAHAAQIGFAKANADPDKADEQESRRCHHGQCQIVDVKTAHGCCRQIWNFASLTMMAMPMQVITSPVITIMMPRGSVISTIA